MKKLFLLLFIFQLLSCSKSSDANNYDKIIGGWQCDGFLIENKHFRAEGKGMVDFYSTYENSSQVRYNYDFGEGQTLDVDLIFFGKWGSDKKGFWDMLTGFEISIVDNSTLLKDRKIKEIISDFYILNKITYAKVEFISEYEFSWERIDELGDVVCTKRESMGSPISPSA